MKLSRFPSWFSSSVAILLGVLTPRAGFAQGATDKAAAEALFIQGRELLAAGKAAEACERFEASNSLDRGVGVLLHLADCYEQTQRLASAWATFEEVASLANSRGESNRAQIARVRSASLKPRLSFVQFDVANAASGQTLDRNGKPIPQAAWGAPIPVDAGAWTIHASAPARETYTLEVRIELEQPGVKHIAIPALLPVQPKPTLATDLSAASPDKASAAPPPPVGNPPDTNGSWQEPAAWVLGGVGVAGLIASGVLSILAVSAKRDADANCQRAGDQERCNLNGTKTQNRAVTFANVASVTGIAGGVVLAGGIGLYFTAPSLGAPGPNAGNAATLGIQGSF
jgi:serine/threonine-protein kinase